jgi:acetyltransferase-like isoleucine patch superfamily enzyme
VKQFFHQVKRRAVKALARELERETGQGPQATQGVHLCRLGTGSVLAPEAQISNLAEDVEAIAIGQNTHIRGQLLTYGHGGKITVGDWCYIGARSEIWSMASISIGDRVLIAHDVNIHDGTAHSRVADERHRHFRHIIERGHPTTADQLPGVFSAAIVIEDDVWISFRVTILKGVTIGRGSIIAAGSIVTQNVPPDTLYRCQISPVMTPLAPVLQP